MSPISPLISPSSIPLSIGLQSQFGDIVILKMKNPCEGNSPFLERTTRLIYIVEMLTFYEPTFSRVSQLLNFSK